MIVLNPYAGLCNRLLAIGAGLHLAEDTRQSLHVFWITDVHMNALFSDLFEMPTRFPMHQLNPLSHRIKNSLAIRLVPCLFPGFSKEERTFLAYEERFLKASKRHPNSLHRITSFREFYPAIDYSWLMPRSEIITRIKNFGYMTEGDVIGMHIRRGDHKQAMTCSPTHLFYDKIAEEIAANPKVRFLLCSDSPEIKQDLKAKYPKNIFTREAVLARNEKGGVADAVVDLWLLSQCRKIYGTFPSSFSLVASKIGKTNFEWIGGESGRR